MNHKSPRSAGINALIIILATIFAILFAAVIYFLTSSWQSKTMSLTPSVKQQPYTDDIWEEDDGYYDDELDDFFNWYFDDSWDGNWNGNPDDTQDKDLHL